MYPTNNKLLFWGIYFHLVNSVLNISCTVGEKHSVLTSMSSLSSTHLPRNLLKENTQSHTIRLQGQWCMGQATSKSGDNCLKAGCWVFPHSTPQWDLKVRLSSVYKHTNAHTLSTSVASHNHKCVFNTESLIVRLCLYMCVLFHIYCPLIVPQYEEHIALCWVVKQTQWGCEMSILFSPHSACGNMNFLPVTFKWKTTALFLWLVTWFLYPNNGIQFTLYSKVNFKSAVFINQHVLRIPFLLHFTIS